MNHRFDMPKGLELNTGMTTFITTAKVSADDIIEVVPTDSGERKRKLDELENRLKNGDLSALSELTKMGIEYKKTDIFNGYRIEFEGREVVYRNNKQYTYAGAKTTTIGTMNSNSSLEIIPPVNTTVDEPSDNSNDVLTSSGELRDYLYGSEFKDKVYAAVHNWDNSICDFDIRVAKLISQHSPKFLVHSSYSVTKQKLIDDTVAAYNDAKAKHDHQAQEISGYGEVAAKLNRQKGSYANDAVNESSTIINPWNNPEGTDIFKTILGNMKFDLNEAGLKIDENILKALLRSAWYAAIPGSNINRAGKIDTREFINNVVEKLVTMLNNLKSHPENLDEYTANPMKIGVNDSTTINIGDINVKYDDGYWHVSDNEQDKKLQAAFKNVLDQIYKMYPNVAKSVLEELFKNCMNTIFGSELEQKPWAIHAEFHGFQRNISLSDLIKNIMVEFSKWITYYGSYNPRVADEEPRTTHEVKHDDSQSADIKSSASGLLSCISNVQSSIVNICKGITGRNWLNTEFGMDKDGNIVFQDSKTKDVFNKIVEQLKNTMQTFASDALNKLAKAAGMSIDNLLQRLVQTAWIATYQSYNSSQDQNLTNFINSVMQNFCNMFKQLEKNPAFLEVFTRRTSYADTTITDGLKHYNTKTTAGNDEKIEYSSPIIYNDGSVHISKKVDDNDYQATMNDLLKRLIDAYPSLDATFITTLFRSAQRAALNACMDNVNDCPYGTANNGSRVEDGNNKDWGGRDNRAKDDCSIHMDQLVQLTLYYFDKLLYSSLINYQK